MIKHLNSVQLSHYQEIDGILKQKCFKIAKYLKVENELLKFHVLILHLKCSHETLKQINHAKKTHLFLHLSSHPKE